MKYTVDKLINTADPLYQKGIWSIEKKRLEKLQEVIQHPDFDSASYEARALLFKAAREVYLEGFHLLGDAHVPLSQPIEIHKRRKHTLFIHDCRFRDVLLTQDENPLHTLYAHINPACFNKIKIGVHFNRWDIQEALNTYSIQANGTPLDKAWEGQQRLLDMLKKESKNGIIVLPDNFSFFLIQNIATMPDFLAPQILNAPILMHRALEKNDISTLYLIVPSTVLLLNATGYHYPQEEGAYLNRYKLVPEGLRQEMDWTPPPEPVQKVATHKNLWQRTFNLVNKIRQK